MDVNSRLRRARRARGVADLDRIPLRQQRRQTVQNGNASSPDSSPGTPPNVGGKDDDSSDEEDARQSRPATRPAVPAPVAVPTVQVVSAVPPNPALSVLPTAGAVLVQDRPQRAEAEVNTITTSLPSPLSPISPASPASPESPKSFTTLTTTRAQTIQTSSTSSLPVPSNTPPPVENPQQSNAPSPDPVGPPQLPPPSSSQSPVQDTATATATGPSNVSTTTTSAPGQTISTTSTLPPPIEATVTRSTVSSSLRPVISFENGGRLVSESPTVGSGLLLTSSRAPGAPNSAIPPFTGTTRSSPAITSALVEASSISSVIPLPNGGESPPPVSLPPVSAPGPDGGDGRTAGIAVGTIAGVGFLAAIIFFLFRTRGRKRAEYHDQPYAGGAGRASHTPTIFRMIQSRFEHWTTSPATHASFSPGKVGDGGGGGSGAVRGAASNSEPRSQSQILNELIQAAYAAEGGLGGPGSGRNSMGDGYYAANEKAGIMSSTRTDSASAHPTPPLFLPAEKVEQPSLRASIGRWLRGHHPLKMNPLGSGRRSHASSPVSAVPSWSWRGPATPSTERSSSHLPPAPMMPDPAFISRWSDSTRQTPPSPSVRQSLAVESNASLFSMYQRRDTQQGFPSMPSVAQPVPPPRKSWAMLSEPSGQGDGSGVASRGRASEVTTNAGESFTTNDLLHLGRLSGQSPPSLSRGSTAESELGVMAAVGRVRTSSTALPPSQLPSILDTPASTTARISIQQPIPAAVYPAPGWDRGLVDRLEGKEAAGAGEVYNTSWPLKNPAI